jgi:hypothetical protein
MRLKDENWIEFCMNFEKLFLELPPRPVLDICVGATLRLAVVLCCPTGWNTVCSTIILCQLLVNATNIATETIA